MYIQIVITNLRINIQQYSDTCVPEANTRYKIQNQQRKKIMYKNMNARKDGVYWAPFIWITQSSINEPNETVNENNVFAFFHFVVPFVCLALGSFLHNSSNCYFTSLNLKLKVHHEYERRQQQMKQKKYHHKSFRREVHVLWLPSVSFHFDQSVFFSSHSSILLGFHLVFFPHFILC